MNLKLFNNIKFLLPLLIIISVILYSILFEKFALPNIVEGLENSCSAKKDDMLYKNNANLDTLKTKVNELSDKLISISSDLENLTNTNAVNSNRLTTIEEKIKKAQQDADRAKSAADSYKTKADELPSLE